MSSVSSTNNLLILCASGQHGSPPAPQDSQKTRCCEPSKCPQDPCNRTVTSRESLIVIIPGRKEIHRPVLQIVMSSFYNMISHGFVWSRLTVCSFSWSSNSHTDWLSSPLGLEALWDSSELSNTLFKTGCFSLESQHFSDMSLEDKFTLVRTASIFLRCLLVNP